jgi:hypothetical protein
MTQGLARFTTVLDSRKKVPMTGRVYLRAIVPIGLMFSLSLICGNLTYLYLSVSFIQMLKVSGLQEVSAEKEERDGKTCQWSRRTGRRVEWEKQGSNLNTENLRPAARPCKAHHTDSFLCTGDHASSCAPYLLDTAHRRA